MWRIVVVVRVEYVVRLGMPICFVQAEDGIRELVRSRGLGDVYKRQEYGRKAKTQRN